LIKDEIGTTTPMKPRTLFYHLQRFQGVDKPGANGTTPSGSPPLTA